MGNCNSWQLWGMPMFLVVWSYTESECTLVNCSSRRKLFTLKFQNTLCANTVRCFVLCCNIYTQKTRCRFNRLFTLNGLILLARGNGSPRTQGVLGMGKAACISRQWKHRDNGRIITVKPCSCGPGVYFRSLQFSGSGVFSQLQHRLNARTISEKEWKWLWNILWSEHGKNV